MNAIDPEIDELSYVEYAKTQSQYLPLPARVDGRGTAVFCWKFTWRERFLLLLRGKLYHTVLTFKQPLQPIKLSLEKPETEQ